MAIERIAATHEQPGAPGVEVDLFEVLRNPEPFQVHSLNIPSQDTLHTPYIAMRFGEFNGRRNMVWIANNSPQEAWNTSETVLPGLFLFDEQTHRLLFAPNHSLPSRDTYRSWSNIYTTHEPLLSILQILIKNGASLHQATLLFDLEARSITNFPLRTGHELSIFIGQAQSLFSEKTGLDKTINPYRLEGKITLDKILAHEFLPVALLTPKDLRRPRKTLAAIAKEWS